MKVWHVLLIQVGYAFVALLFWAFWVWLFISIGTSGARVITGNCDAPWLSNGLVNTDWFCPK